MASEGGLQRAVSTDFETPKAIAALEAAGCSRASFLVAAPLEVDHTQWVLDAEPSAVLKDTIEYLQLLREHFEVAISRVNREERRLSAREVRFWPKQFWFRLFLSLWGTKMEYLQLLRKHFELVLLRLIRGGRLLKAREVQSCSFLLLVAVSSALVHFDWVRATVGIYGCRALTCRLRLQAVSCAQCVCSTDYRACVLKHWPFSATSRLLAVIHKP
jgi:hypothetical protein